MHALYSNSLKASLGPHRDTSVFLKEKPWEADPRVIHVQPLPPEHSLQLSSYCALRWATPTFIPHYADVLRADGPEDHRPHITYVEE